MLLTHLHRGVQQYANNGLLVPDLQNGLVLPDRQMVMYTFILFISGLYTVAIMFTD